MNEREFFDERQEAKRANFTCPHCRERGDYEVRWLRRTKKREVPRGASQTDKQHYQRARDHMVRIDDMIACAHCRKRFDIPNSQSVVFI